MTPRLLYDQLILFGDSLLQGSFSQENGFAFGAALADDYVRRLDVVNRGFSGYNTAQGLHVLPSIIPSPEIVNIRFLIIFFGANDACLKGFPTNQHVSLSKYGQNLQTMIQHALVQAHAPRLILITPPPVNEYQLFDGGAGRAAPVTRKYAERCKEIGAEMEVPVVDLWTQMMKEAGWTSDDQPLAGSLKAPRNAKLEELLSDGLHFRPAGYKVLYGEVVRLIAREWPDQIAESLPRLIPGWREAEPQEEEF